MAEHIETIRDGIKSLHLSQEYSDLTVQCGAKEWKVHKAIVCSQSGFFKKACKGDWLEATKGVVKLHDESEAVVDQLIRFLYTSAYDEVPPDCGTIEFNVKMFAAADKFCIDGLGHLAALHFGFRLSLFDDRQDFIRAAYELYRNAPDAGADATEMREMAVEKATRNSYDLLTDERSKDEEAVDFGQLLRDIPEFGQLVMVRLAAAFAEKHHIDTDARTYRCDRCRSCFTIADDPLQRKIKCPLCTEIAKFLY